MTITPNLPFDSYQSIKRMNGSTLIAARESMLALKDAIDYPREETSALRFGSGFHALALTPDEFDATFTIEPDFHLSPDNTTKDGKPSTSTATEFVKQKKAEFRQSDKRIPLTVSEYYSAKQMVAAIYANREARELIERAGPNREVTLEGVIEGVEMKGRVDLLCPDCIPDLKSSATVDYWEFGKAAAKYGWFFKMAIYQELVHQHFNHRDCCFIVVQKSRPFDCVVDEVPQQALDVQLSHVRSYLRQYKECLESGIWPGVDRGQGRRVMFVPKSELEPVAEFATVVMQEPEEVAEVEIPF